MMSALSLDAVERVEFFKRDRITTDLICCEITCRDGRFLEWDEDMSDWRGIIALLEELSGFDRDWFAKVSQPPFEPSCYVAYQRPA
ncbi:MAG: hypothetical protein AAF559_09415 [Pseudomonadota bacterium]